MENRPGMEQVGEQLDISMEVAQGIQDFVLGLKAKIKGSGQTIDDAALTDAIKSQMAAFSRESNNAIRNLLTDPEK